MRDCFLSASIRAERPEPLRTLSRARERDRLVYHSLRMTAPKLLNKSLDELLEDVKPLSGMGVSDEQVRSVLAVVAKCARELTDALTAAGTESGKLTQQLVRLNRSLTSATWVIAGATVLLVVVTVLAARCARKTAGPQRPRDRKSTRLN